MNTQGHLPPSAVRQGYAVKFSCEWSESGDCLMQWFQKESFSGFLVIELKQGCPYVTGKVWLHIIENEMLKSNK